MSLEKFIEDRISKAMAEGEFDNLEGKGKPLDLNWYFQMPEDLRLGYSILKSSDCIPPEAATLKEIDELKLQLASCTDESERKKITKAINEREIAFRLQIEQRRRKSG